MKVIADKNDIQFAVVSWNKIIGHPPITRNKRYLPEILHILNCEGYIDSMCDERNKLVSIAYVQKNSSIISRINKINGAKKTNESLSTSKRRAAAKKGLKNKT